MVGADSETMVWSMVVMATASTIAASTSKLARLRPPLPAAGRSASVDKTEQLLTTIIVG